jgi:hypothetical protein
MSSRIQGPAKFEQIGQGSEVLVQGVPNWAFLYNASTTKLPKYNIGDRVVTPDGRVFRYALAGGTIHTEFMVCDPDASITNAVAPAQVNPTSPVILGIPLSSGKKGDYCVTITVGATDGKAGDAAVAQDEMKGGFVVIGNGANQHPMTRGILGNEATISGGGAQSMNVYLDGALTRDVVVGTDNCEAYLNVYGDVKSMNVVNSAYVTAIGAAAAEATTGQYFWVQTWGNVWLTSNSLTGEAADGRDLYVNTDGSLRGGLSTFQALQRVGVGLDKSASNASNGPNCLLQLSI